MSRIAQHIVVERENYIRNLFRGNPELTGIEAQAMLTKQYGQMMRPNRLYELKKEVEKKAMRVKPIVTSAQNVAPKATFRTLNADLLKMQNRMEGLQGGEVVMMPVLILKR